MELGTEHIFPNTQSLFKPLDHPPILPFSTTTLRSKTSGERHVFRKREIISLNYTEVAQSQFVAQEELFKEHRSSGWEAFMAKSNTHTHIYLKQYITSSQTQLKELSFQ